MRHYFAYSSALDAEAFDVWKNQHGFSHYTLPAGRLGQALDVELVFDFPSRFWGGRALGLAPAPGKRVEGMLLAIEDAHWGIVQHKEGVVTGSAVELPVQVQLPESNEIIAATAFVTNPTRRSTDGPVSEMFLQAVRRAYQTRGLSAAALQALEAAALK
ncbi:MAG: gamma-glutamylcyclotransferase [Bdellovibrionales bacterium]|nr:gamma-glutamylcyclotransferase [Bdellovibrionales bacterium]